MRLAVISHSCVVDVNQRIYAAMTTYPEISALQLLTPANWRNEFTGKPYIPTVLPDLPFPLLHRPVYQPGHISLHFYKDNARREWQAFRPTVLYAEQEPWSLSNLQALLLSRHLKVPYLFYSNQNIRKSLPPPFSWIEQLTYRHAVGCICCAEQVHDVLVSKGFRKTAHVIPYSVELDAFFPDVEKRAAQRAELGIAPDEFVIGFMGRLVRDKGVTTLIEAADRLLKSDSMSNRKLRFLIIGGGAQDEMLRQQASKTGQGDRFLFTSSVPHNRAGDYLRCMDVYVLPSITLPNWKEQFGRVLIEALASGVPVVGSDSGEIPFVIRATGGGLVFHEQDAADLADKLQTLILDDDLRRQFAENGNRAVHEKYKTTTVARQLCDVFAGYSLKDAG